MDDASAAYDAFAPIYDDFNRHNDYEMWLGVLLPELEKRGLRRGRVLDVGCGTGMAFGPLLRRGWEVWGCDASPGMLAQAKRKFGDAVPLEVADLRRLPRFGEFELVVALNDVVNYLTEDGDFEAALAGIRANLAPGGLALFDANSLNLFQRHFAEGESAEMNDRGRTWHGLSGTVEPGGVCEARVSGDDVQTHVHRQRHYPLEHVREAMGRTGLDCLAALGQQEVEGRAVLVDPADEARDHKIVYIAGPAAG
jgi:SAM-dependent methyltransferase